MEGVTDSIFKPVQQPDYFRKFEEQHPNPIWRDYLKFLLEQFPQDDDTGKIPAYIIEGGTAIKLHCPERRDPGDIDIIDLRGNFRELIGPNTRWFNAVTPEEWAKAHGLGDSEKAKEVLLHGRMTVDFEDRKVTILDKPTLAATKVLPYKDRQRREGDISDLKILGYDIPAAEKIAETFK